MDSIQIKAIFDRISRIIKDFFYYYRSNLFLIEINSRGY